MKCEICGSKIKYTFLKKIKGAYVKDKNGKAHIICSSCQKRYGSKDEILKNLK